MSDYLPSEVWATPVPIGGVWDWDGPPGWGPPDFAIAVVHNSGPQPLWMDFERAFDDANLASGQYVLRLGRCLTRSVGQ